MISRFFIDRPIFAAVLSIVITLAGAIALLSLPVAQYPEITPPSVSVSISYPGASAQVVADTVAAPIEQQVTGVEGMLYMSSQSGNDGSYTLTVTFDIGTNLNTALVMVQNRVELAIPQLPTSVQKQGITLRKRTPDILMVVSFFSPNRRYDNLYLSNYALINVQDPLFRVDGVSDINILGERDYSIRIWLDPQKLAAYNLAAADVVNAIGSQNIEVAAGQVGEPPARPGQSFELPLDALGRLWEPEQFADIIVKSAQGPPTLSYPGVPGTSEGGSGTAIPLPGSTTGLMAGGATLGGPATTSLVPGGTTTSGPATPVNLLTSGSISGGTTRSPSATSGSSTGSGTTGGTMTGSGTTGSTGGTSSSGGGTTGATGSSGSSTSGVMLTVPGMSSAATVGTSLPAPALTADAIVTATTPSSTGTTGNTGASASTTTGSTAGGNTTGGAAAGVTTATPGTSTGASMSAVAMAPAASIVHLRDVARVELGAQNYNQFATFDRQPAAGLAIHQLPGSNALDVANRIRQKMEELRKRFPDGVDYDIAYDTTPFIRESVDDVVWTLFEAVGLVALVVLVFLQSWRAALIPLVAVPVAIVGTFAIMAALGFSLNNISLFGLVLAIGIVVDDAIVVVENVERWLDHGLPPREAARRAMDEVTGPVIAVALVLCAVFVPCAFISGITGQFFRQFAVTISVSTVFSAINSLTLSPALAAILLRARTAEHATRSENRGMARRALQAPGLALQVFFRLFNRVFGAGTAAYTWAVGWLLRASGVVLLAYGGLLFLTWHVFQRAPTGFVPEQDQGRLIVSVQLPDSAALWRTQHAVAEVEKIALGDKEDRAHFPGILGIAHTTTVSGMSLVLQANASNFGTIFVVLDPFDKRRRPELSADAIAARLREACARQVKDAKVTVLGAPAIPGLSVAGGFKLMVEDRGGLGTSFLQTQTEKLIAEMQHQRTLTDVSTQFRSNTPQLYMDIDRVKVKSLGLSLGDVNQTLQTYLGSVYVNSFNEFGRYWQVTAQAEGRYRARVAGVGLLQARNSQGQMVPLSTLVNVREINGPVMVLRYNLRTAAPVTGNVAPGASSGEAIEAVDRLAASTLPRSMATEWTELMFMQIRAGNTAIYVFLLAVVAVFLALAALYESWTLPLAVILVVPLCLLCSVAGVLFTHTAVNIFVQIGLVVLVGLACKNAILIVEFARDQRRQGRPRYEATREAANLRLRPILMTSLAFILGVVPLVIATGAGAEMRRSLGTAVFSGMLGVTLFGIFLTPVFFYVIEGLGETPVFTAAITRWAGSALAGAGLGLASGYLLARLGFGRLPGAAVAGAALGAVLALLIPTFWRWLRSGGLPR